MLLKTGVNLKIIRQGSLETVAKGKAIQERTGVPTNEFIYFATKAIAADIPNGNGDFFPWDHLLKSYATFIGRNLFLNHNSSDPRNAIGKVLDAYPVVDAQSGERYIECLAKVDAVAHPDLARQIQAGILDSCSMGCSVESSQCSVCGHTIYSDQDQKCHHMSKGLGQEFHAELDFPEFNIKKGSATKAFAVNRGLNFTELSVVNVPAWDNAKIVQVIAKLKEEATSKGVTSEMVKDLEDILQMASKNDLEKETAPAVTAAAPAAESKEVVANAAAPADNAATPAESPKAETSSETKAESHESRLKKLFKEKLSALDFLDLQAFMKKATGKELPTELVTDAPAEAPKAEAATEPKVEVKTETKVEAPVEAKKDEKCKCGKKECKECAMAEKKEEKKADLAATPAPEATPASAPIVEAPKVEEVKTEAKVEAKAEVKAETAAPTPASTPAPEAKVEAPAEAPKTETIEAMTNSRKLKAIFVSKPTFKDSYWVITDDGKPILKAALGDIWGDKLTDVSDYAASPVYGEALLQRLKEDGVKKVALLTNATIYAEAGKSPEGAANGVESPVKAYTGNIGQTMPGKEPATSAKMRNPNWKPADNTKDVYKDVPGAEPGTGSQSWMSGGRSASSAKHPEGIDLDTKDTGPASRGQVGKGEEWPTQRSVGSTQYKPAGAMGKAHMKEMPEGTDMSGGDRGKASAGPTWGHGDQSPSSGKVGKDQYKELGAITKEAGAALEKEADEMPGAMMEMPGAAPAEAAPEGAEHPAAGMPGEEEGPAEEEAKEMQCPKGSAAEDPMAFIEHAEGMIAELLKACDDKKLKGMYEKVMQDINKAEEAYKKHKEKADKEAEKAQAAADKENKAMEKAEKEEGEEGAEGKEEGGENMEKTAEATPEAAPETAPVAEIPAEASVEAQITERERELESQLVQLKLEQSLRAKTLRCQALVNEMLDKELIAADEGDIQEEIANGKPLFDARAAAFKKAIDKQCRDLLAMEESTLQAFAQTVKRMKGRSIPQQSGGVLKKAFKLEFNEHTNEDAWLGDVFGQMGSQKGKKFE